MLSLTCVAGVALFASRILAYLTPEGEVVIPGAASYNGLGLVPQMGFDNCKTNSQMLLNLRFLNFQKGMRLVATSMSRFCSIPQRPWPTMDFAT
jgi:hypothetical protein